MRRTAKPLLLLPALSLLAATLPAAALAAPAVPGRNAIQAIGPKQDDPLRACTPDPATAGGSGQTGPNSGIIPGGNPAAIGPKPDDPGRAGVQPPGIRNGLIVQGGRQAPGATTAIGPKPDEPRTSCSKTVTPGGMPGN